MSFGDLRDRIAGPELVAVVSVSFLLNFAYSGFVRHNFPTEVVSIFFRLAPGLFVRLAAVKSILCNARVCKIRTQGVEDVFQKRAFQPLRDGQVAAGFQVSTPGVSG